MRKIIEETKQHLIDLMKGDEELGLYEHGQEVGHSVQVEETLEEAAERNKLDLNKLEEKLDAELKNETSESLTNWLKEKRDKTNNMAQQNSIEWLIDKVFDYTLHKDMGQIFTKARKMYKEEKKYSEEEVLKLLIKFSDDRTFLKKDVSIQWFDKNKKQ